jgi:hypothetical protein
MHCNPFGLPPGKQEFLPPPGGHAYLRLRDEHGLQLCVFLHCRLYQPRLLGYDIAVGIDGTVVALSRLARFFLLVPGMAGYLVGLSPAVFSSDNGKRWFLLHRLYF